jgi:hypothetical protein
VTEACREGGPLAPATLHSGEIDVWHPAVIAWAQKRGLDPAVLAPSPDGARTSSGAIKSKKLGARTGGERAAPETSPDRIGRSREDFADLTFRKRAAEAVKLELANEEKKGTLISRELVRVHCYGAIDGAWRHLLGDTAQTLTARLYAMARSGHSLEEGVAVTRTAITANLKRARDEVRRVLGEGKSSVENDPK